MCILYLIITLFFVINNSSIRGPCFLVNILTLFCLLFHWYWTAWAFCAVAGCYKIALGAHLVHLVPLGAHLAHPVLPGPHEFPEWSLSWTLSSKICFVDKTRRRRRRHFCIVLLYFTKIITCIMLCNVIIGHSYALWRHCCLMSRQSFFFFVLAVQASWNIWYSNGWKKKRRRKKLHLFLFIGFIY